MKTGTVYYPRLINEQALYVGGLRDVTNAYMNEQAPKYKRGNLQVDQLGCKCELIAQFYFWNKGVRYKSDQMLGGRAMPNYDIEAAGLKIDVKGIWSYQNELRVNYDAHNKDKNVTHYLFIQPVKDTLDNEHANWWLYGKKSIDDWFVKELKYSKAYTKQL
jgi:hypothetical protein